MHHLVGAAKGRLATRAQSAGVEGYATRSHGQLAARWQARWAVRRENEGTMHIAGSVALVTGANRGIGQALSRALLDHGAARVYAAARRPAAITDPRLTPLLLDVTDQDSIAAAAAVAQDAAIVVNNAGIAQCAPLSARRLSRPGSRGHGD